MKIPYRLFTCLQVWKMGSAVKREGMYLIWSHPTFVCFRNGLIRCVCKPHTCQNIEDLPPRINIRLLISTHIAVCGSNRFVFRYGLISLWICFNSPPSLQGKLRALALWRVLWQTLTAHRLCTVTLTAHRLCSRSWIHKTSCSTLLGNHGSFAA